MHPACSTKHLPVLSGPLWSLSCPLSSPQVGSSKGQLAQLHPACSNIREDDDGLLPEWVIYHELVATSKPFLRQASAKKCDTGRVGYLPQAYRYMFLEASPKHLPSSSLPLNPSVPSSSLPTSESVLLRTVMAGVSFCLPPLSH